MGVLRPGETCWRLAKASRVKFLVDGQDYLRALELALKEARRSIAILGWGFDPRIRFTPDGEEIGHRLTALAKANPALDVRILIWRSALPISATQDFFPHRAKAWFRGSSVRFDLDATVPFGACHHQKVVVIDDALAFVGGADLMPGRWDTGVHRDREPARRHPGRFAYRPRHEVMAMVEGEAAAMLGALFRERWRNALGESLAEPSEPGVAVWPADVVPDLAPAEVAIARTLPAWRGAPGVGEIAALTLEAIFAAKRLIYMENQYFTWPLAVEALAARLAEPDGPEIVLVCNESSPSYFDKLTMDRARSTALWRLKSSDVFSRFHAFAPATARGRPIVTHAKVMVIDDALVRIGSANLNNRSQGFDTECELAFEAATSTEGEVIAALRDRLAGHWIGRSASEVSEATARGGGFVAVLRSLDSGGSPAPAAGAPSRPDRGVHRRLPHRRPRRRERRVAAGSPTGAVAGPDARDQAVGRRSASRKSTTSGRWSEATRDSGSDAVLTASKRTPRPNTWSIASMGRVDGKVGAPRTVRAARRASVSSRASVR